LLLLLLLLLLLILVLVLSLSDSDSMSLKGCGTLRGIVVVLSASARRWPRERGGVCRAAMDLVDYTVLLYSSLHDLLLLDRPSTGLDEA
jgi:hypothetical protein